jgi:subtilisin family serine protease
MKNKSLLPITILLLMVLFIVSSCRKEAKDLPVQDKATVSIKQQDRAFIVIAEEGKKLGPITESLEKLNAAGYKVKNVIPELGLIHVQTPDTSFPGKARKIAGVQSVVVDISTNWEVPVKAVRAHLSAPKTSNGVAKAIGVPSGDPYGVLQWDLQSVKAHEAWAKGYLGNGVKVAVLDGGFLIREPEIALQIVDTHSFIPDEAVEAFAPQGEREYFSQGTCAAGIIAAAHNGRRVVGIAPQARLMLIKVISDMTHEAPWSSLIDGIFYAANHGAKVIEMNVAGKLPRKTYTDDNGTPNYPGDDYVVEYNRDIRDLVIALTRATLYANLMGATLVAPAGDNPQHPYNYDVEKNFATYPAAAPGVLCIGSNGPNGWGFNQDTTLYVPSSFSNYGRSYIRFGAPGGNYGPLTDPSAVAEVEGYANWEYLFNYIYNVGFWVPDTEVYYDSWAYGSALAAAHAAAVIALIYGKHPGTNALFVDAILRNSADDYGAPGKDAYFGYGQVNAGKAVDY